MGRLSNAQLPRSGLSSTIFFEDLSVISLIRSYIRRIVARLHVIIARRHVRSKRIPLANTWRTRPLDRRFNVIISGLSINEERIF
jgi:hypothetical protein